jgi:adenine-specific DNA-methyltransferase
MAAPSPKFQKLLTKLRELFELDKADLDFGLYRVLRARRDEIDKFLREELLPQVQGELGVVTEEKIKPLEAKVEEEIAKVMEYGGKTREEAEASDKVIAAKSLLEQSRNPAALEDEVYSLLATFFGRYYEAGDFISQRRYSGPGKEKYMLPYNGEEVKLVWANMDQYYIKSAENFRDYTFRVPALEPDESVPVPDQRPRVSFKLIEADTEKDNVKATAVTGKRAFALADPAHHPLELATEDGLSVLRIPFTYAVRDKDDKQDALLADAEAVVLESATVPDDLKKHLSAKAPTGTRADRTVLAKHLEAYAAKNSFDYFIHKDLGGFLSRELDYFLKSELLRVDDLLTHDDHQRTLTLKKARAFRKVAEKIVTFLHRQEQFQKKLWLKKKFVVATDYAITLDRISEEFYPEIAANDAQREEWVKLHAIDEIEKDTTTPGYSVPLTVEFLKAHHSLMVDTRNFSGDFKTRVLSSIPELDVNTSGLLIRSLNQDAVTSLGGKFNERIKSIYLDPPYNTGDDGFSYKDCYQHASWMSMMSQVLSKSRRLLRADGVVHCSIDRDENRNLLPLFFGIFGEENFVEEVIWQKAYGGGSKTKLINNLHEYVICFANSKTALPAFWLPPNPETAKYYKFSDAKFPTRGKFRTQPLYTNSNAYRPNLTFPLPIPASGNPGDSAWNEQLKIIRQALASEKMSLEGSEGTWRYIVDGELWSGRLISPPKQWQWSWDKASKAIIEDELVYTLDGGEWSVDYKQYQFKEDGSERGVKPPSILIGPYTQSGTAELSGLFGAEVMKFPKPPGLIENLLAIDHSDNDAYFCDCFAGSGTTGHAIINLNRADAGSRKYILIEMGDHFDTVLVPRVKKLVYSPDWKDGKPTTRHKGISHCVKILRLESYEDCLNNLELTRSDNQKDLLSRNPALREDYLLGYFLDVETRGSVLKLDHFRDPWNYRMKIATGSVGETRETPIDLVETFNWLLGLTVQHQNNLQHRRPDKGFAEDEHGRLQLTGGLTRAADPTKNKDSRTFQTIEGTLRSGEKVLVIWRSLTQPQKDEDAARLLEEDNVMLEAFLSRTALNPREKQWDLIYVNGDHTLDNLAERLAEDPENTAPRFKVRTIEPEFHRLMFEGTED